LGVAVDPETNAHAWTATLRLADRFDLRLYDAAYLEFALQRRAPLATLDEALRSAAATLEAPLLGADARAKTSRRRPTITFRRIPAVGPA
jgi:predicted nucleic acid-binding protein